MLNNSIVVDLNFMKTIIPGIFNYIYNLFVFNVLYTIQGLSLSRVAFSVI